MACAKSLRRNNNFYKAEKVQFGRMVIVIPGCTSAGELKK